MNPQIDKIMKAIDAAGGIVESYDARIHVGTENLVSLNLVVKVPWKASPTHKLVAFNDEPTRGEAVDFVPLVIPDEVANEGL